MDSRRLVLDFFDAEHLQSNKPNGEDDPRVLRFKGTEGVSKLYRYYIDIVIEIKNAPKDPRSKYLNKPGCLMIQRGPETNTRYVSGIVTGFEPVHFTKYRTVYRLCLEPLQARMALRSRHKRWAFDGQEKTAKEIISAMMAEWSAMMAESKLEWGWDLQAEDQLERRKFCQQFFESDWSFCCRLLESEGIAYYFEHSKGAVKTWFIDQQTSGYKTINKIPPAGGDGEPRVVFAPDPIDTDFISSFTVGRDITSGASQVRDYFSGDPRTTMEGKHQAEGATSDEKQYENFVFPGAFSDLKHAQAQTPMRVQGLQAEAGRGHGGGGSFLRFCAGYRFMLGGEAKDDGYRHLQGELNDKHYLLMDIEHAGCDVTAMGTEPFEPLGFLGVELSGNRHNTVSIGVLRAHEGDKVQWRPPRDTKRPTIPGVVPARVVGKEGDEICVNKEGHVKVWFPWDREGTEKAQANPPRANIDDTSCWVPVSHGWAGTGYGQIFLPRIGQEVLVAFLYGDPDRPIIVGRVFNGEQNSPVEEGAENDVSKQATHSVIRSNTVGGKGFNEIRLIDDAGKEQFKVTAQRDWTTKVKHDRVETIDNDEIVHIASKQEHYAKTILLQGEERITLKVEGSVIELTKEGIVIRGSKISTSAGSGVFDIKGGKIMLNCKTGGAAGGSGSSGPVKV